MQQILVTGGSGFLGANLVRTLAAEGHQVRVLTRSEQSARKILPATVDIVEGDVADANACEQSIKGCDVVFHLAAAYQEPGISDQRYHDVHVGGTKNLLNLARTEGVSRFVHCSTVGVLSHIENPPADETWPHSPGDVYQETKSEAEKFALEFQQKYSFPLAVARPTPIYGPGDKRLLKLFSMIERGRFIILGDGKVFYHMVYVDDLVRGVRLLAEHPDAIGEVFTIGGAEYCTLNELAEIIAEELGVSPPRIHLPAWPVQVLGSIVERVCIPFKIEPPIYRRRVDFFTKSRAFSIEKARRIVGYEPQVSLREGVRATIQWYRSEGYLSGS
jgi:nucleoside-diphosphate-sugar epimerase